MACGILVPQPGIEPAPLALKARSPNHWTAREFRHLANSYQHKHAFKILSVKCLLDKNIHTLVRNAKF